VADAEHPERRFRLLFDRYYRRVLGYALRRTASGQVAEDVVAETFMVAWRRIGDVPPADEALPWLLGVARRVLANSRRAEGRRDRLQARLEGVAGREASSEADEAVLASEQQVEILAALERLRPNEAEILQLAVWEELTHAQIAVVLDCSVNAVGIRLHRARQAFREQLKLAPSAGHFPMTQREQLRDPSAE
jgi:RNA polymerase sigma-70 factor (ECF subfamily)